MQILRGGYYRQKSDNNRITVIPLESPRGKISDRNGALLVDNRLSFDVSLIYKDATDLNGLVNFLSSRLNLDKKTVLRGINKARYKPYASMVIAEDISKDQAFMLEQERVDFPGVRITTRPMREYLLGPAASALTGYLGMIREEELLKFKTYGYNVWDMIGRAGLERSYDNYLRGATGGMQIETDSRGRQTQLLDVMQPEPGKSLNLTVDAELQKVCDESLGDRKGAVIVMDPQSGAVLAYVSHPSYDPNIFVSPSLRGAVTGILLNKSGDFPLVDRCVNAAFPPGSVFKVVVSAAALETGKYVTGMTFDCPGYFNLGKATFKCWKDGGHGPQTMLNAIKHSCNVFFYKLGLKVGGADISSYARKFGFGRPTGIDMPNEFSGIVPSPRWKQQVKKEGWYEGDTVNFSIGQGYLLVTPLQVACMMSAVANGGYLVKPYLVDTIDDVKFGSPRVEKTGISENVISVIREGLIKCVNDPDGTGKYAAIPGAVLAGKTGTAQNPTGKNHGWFAGYGPVSTPKVCVVAFVEQSGKGGGEASRVAGPVFQKCFELGYLQ